MAVDQELVDAAIALRLKEPARLNWARLASIN
jgi:hypothetical protein